MEYAIIRASGLPTQCWCLFDEHIATITALDGIADSQVIIYKGFVLSLEMITNVGLPKISHCHPY